MYDAVRRLNRSSQVTLSTRLPIAVLYGCQISDRKIGYRSRAGRVAIVYSKWLNRDDFNSAAGCPSDLAEIWQMVL